MLDSKSGVHTVWYNMSNTTWSNITYMTNSTDNIIDTNVTYNDTINTLNYTDGINYTFYFYANDSVSNEANASITIGFDNSPPSKASLEYPNAGMIIGGMINLSTLINDNLSGIQNVSFYNITENLTDDGNVTSINWTLIGTNASGNSTAGYDHNWTFSWNTSLYPDSDYYLAINVTDKVYNTSNYNESASMDIASQNGNGSNSSGGIFVQVRNTDPIITFYSPQNSTNSTPLEGLVDVNFIITSITGINRSTIELIITNETSAEYPLYDSSPKEFDPEDHCGEVDFKNDSYFNMTFYGYNCTIRWHTLKSGENGTTLDDQNLTLTASGYSNDIDNDTMKVPSKHISEDWNVTVNNTGAEPSIFLLQPLNPYFSSGQTINFTFYVLDNEDTNMTCDLYIDDEFHNRSASVYNGNSTHNTTVLSSNGTITGSGRHIYVINCTNLKYKEGNYSSSIIIDPEKISYVILLPSYYSNYSNSQFNSIGQNISATINSNSLIYTAFIDTPHYYSIPERATILYFDENSFGSESLVSGNIKAFDGEHVTIVLHPQYITPDLIRKFNNLFKGLNDDPYIDVSWGIVTGKYSSSAGSLADRSLGTVALNQTTHHNYYEPESLQFTRSSAFAPLEQAYQAAAAFIRNALNAAGAGTLYTGSDASNINIFNRLDNSDDSNIIYFAGGGRNDKLYRNSSDTSDISGDFNICPFVNTQDTTIECRDKGVFSDFKNRLVLFSTSDYFARISQNDTNPSFWDLNNGAEGDWIPDESL
ncbi:MAG: hypothetical protein U9O53_03990, partial [archaeon]|nr:hypothetical protein [archaeon]